MNPLRGQLLTSLIVCLYLFIITTFQQVTVVFVNSMDYTCPVEGIKSRRESETGEEKKGVPRLSYIIVTVYYL